MAEASLTMSVYGESKSGKSRLSRTAPTPILLFDAENIGKDSFKTMKKVYWNPLEESIPEYDPNDPYKVCIVSAFSFETIQAAVETLRSHDHPFRSVVFDSMSEIQAYLREKIFGKKSTVTFQEWGKLKKDLEKLMRDMKAIVNDRRSPVLALVYLFMEQLVQKEGQDDHTYPMFQGSAKNVIKYISDILAYTYTDTVYDKETDDTHLEYRLLVGKMNGYETANRVTIPTKDGEEKNLPDIMGGNTTITGLLKAIYPELSEELSKPDANPNWGGENSSVDTETGEIKEAVSEENETNNEETEK